ncbi:helix-turn-helix transcriptional regulator [Chitinophaga niabensis]|uniref:Helix-turn-helix domain-containing protein n=1 Tax=Chitinophaga niabensis TaxID=536979 RepID=A0A1N6JIT5_9BACT|nr:helix-turn-helix transcriptional regulator [Chitinophaga niabensis]SIO44087.1 Helix-turn-helix domain-containing protein [Chitinophaga niabensis]
METVSKNIIHEGARLKQIVRDKRMKILEFADLAGFSNQIAHYYFRKEAIKRATLLEFCALLGISLDEFYNWTHPRRTQPQPAVDFHQGQRLDELIEEKGLNKTKLADRMGLSRRALYNLLDKSVFTPDQMKKICQVLEISAKEFLGGNHVEENGADGPEIESWKDKYYRLLEDYNKALVEIARLKELQ